MPKSSTPPRPKEPYSRMGVFKCLDDVPDRYRLRNSAGRFEDVDVWNEYVETRSGLSDSWYRRIGRAEDAWKSQMAECRRHHALATPNDVGDWCDDLLANREPKTAYWRYWSYVEQFYWWLQWHTDYPHRYSPVLMAASEYESAGLLWHIKVNAGKLPKE